MALLLAAALLSVPPAVGQSPSKVALVVGNAGYAHAPPLANSKNDAEDIAAVLESLGFAVEKADGSSPRLRLTNARPIPLVPGGAPVHRPA